MPRTSKPKFITKNGSVADAVSNATSILQELAEEMRTWADNLEEKFSATDKYARVNEAADTLEGLEEPSVEDEQGEIIATWTESTKKKQSRADRRDEAAGMLDAAASALREHAEELQEKMDAMDKAAETQAEAVPGAEPAPAPAEAVAAEPKSREELEAEKDACEALADEIERVKDDAEAVEFPGMYG